MCHPPASSNDPASEHRSASGEVVRRDAGGWISGPAVTVEAVPAGQVTAGDRLILDDGTIADVDVIQPASVRLPGGQHAPGRALWWLQRGGTASGVLVRADSDTLHRVTP